MILKIITNKKGSYILEAAITLPIFLIAVVVMCSIILMYACIEDANFIVATELRKATAEAITTNTSLLVPGRIESRIKNHSQVSYLYITDFGYRVGRWGEDELIPISFKMKLETNSPMGLASKSEYELSSVARAYVGKIRELDNMSKEEMESKGDAVYIFPKSGEKYHAEGCSYLKSACKAAILDSAYKNKYSPCAICHSGNAHIGSLIYYFPKAGESYHLPGCEALNKNYIEIEKKVAIKRGYKPCSKCGG